MTREGTYRLMQLAEYSRPSRVGYASQQGAGSAPVKVSFVGCGGGDQEKIAFNYGRELFVYPYRGISKSSEAKLLDKRVYKGTSPTCHDFGPPGCLKLDSPDVIPLLVGFTGGQIHLIDPVHKELSRLYNEERLLDKTKVTCLRWAPGRGDTFLVSHASGMLYTYQAELDCHHIQPQYQLSKQGEGFSLYTCKAKTIKNPVSRCAIGSGSINEFTFSPCGQFLAVVGQDGLLRVFHYDSMELVGACRSYFGGLLCLAWSPDGKYIAAGGEDDLVTVYSFFEKRVVVRCQGHRSWVSVVTFDLYNVSYGDVPDGLDFSGSDEESGGGGAGPPSTCCPPHSTLNSPPTAHRASSSTATTSSPDQQQQQPLSVVRGTAVSNSNGNRGVENGILASQVASPSSEGGEDTRTSPAVSSAALAAARRAAQNRRRRSSERRASCRDSVIDTSSSSAADRGPVTCYRFGSVGQDTLICLWDLTEDILKQSAAKHKAKYPDLGGDMSHSNSLSSKDSGLVADSSNPSSGASSSSYDKQPSPGTGLLSYRLASLNFGSNTNRETGSSSGSGHKRAFSLPLRSSSDKRSDASTSGTSIITKMGKDGGAGTNPADSSGCDVIGSLGCPRLSDTPIMEPVVVKKIAHERLTALVFREECLVTACQDGYVCTWARPGHANGLGGTGTALQCSNLATSNTTTTSYAPPCSTSPSTSLQAGPGTVV